MNKSTKELHNYFSLLLWLNISLLLAAFIFIYKSTMSALVKTWTNQTSYSHGFLIPLISLYLIYLEWKKLRQLSVRPNIFGGIVLTIAGCFIFVLGNISSIVTLQELSMLVVIPGIILMLLGNEFLKRLALPIGYLIFMISAMDIFLDRLHWPSQLFSATMASNALKLLNIPVHQSSNYLELPNVTLEVANACSGVRHIISIIALGIPLAYLTQQGLWRKILLIAFGVIVGIFTNGFRIVLISIWAYNGGEVLHGPFHIFQGLFVAVFGYFVLILGAIFLRKISPGITKESNKPVKEIPEKPLHNIKHFNQGLFIAVGLLLVTGGHSYLYEPKPVRLSDLSERLPGEIGDWRMEKAGYQNDLFRVEGADFEVVRFYKNVKGRTIRAYIGYFESQRQDKELVYYKNDILFRNAKALDISFDDGDNAKVNRTVFKNGNKTSLVLFWYDLNGRVVANKYEAKLITAFDGLLYRRTNGAIIIVSSDLDNPTETEEVLKDEIDFVHSFFPVLKNYLS